MKARRQIILWTYLFFCCFYTMNVSSQIVRGNGDIKKERRSVSSFDKILAKGAIDVYLSQSDEEYVVVETDQNVLPFVKTKVEKGGVLIIKMKKGSRIRNVKKMNVYVGFKNLNDLESKGSGDLACTADLNLKTLKVQNSGSGNMYLKGNVSMIEIKNSGSGDIKSTLKSQSTHISNRGSGDLRLKGKTSEGIITNSGSGDVQAFDFEATKMTLKNSGSGDVEVNVVEKFSLRNSGSGDVTYKGQAEIVNLNVSGSGNIKKKVNHIKNK